MKLIPAKYDNKVLDQLFREGTVPEPATLVGQWRVDMLTGIVPSMYAQNHRKLFWPDQDTKLVGGCNVLFRDYRWGRFEVSKSTSDLDNQPILLIDYNLPTNGPSNIIRDQVRELAPGLLLGRFCLMLFGKPRFLGYFTLTKI